MKLLDDQLLTIQEVSQITRVPVPTLRYWRATGRGGPKSARLGGRVVYRLSDVQAWVDEAFGGCRVIEPNRVYPFGPDYDETIRQIVDAAPPLSAAQRDKLATLLSDEPVA